MLFNFCKAVQMQSDIQFESIHVFNVNFHSENNMHHKIICQHKKLYHHHPGIKYWFEVMLHIFVKVEFHCMHDSKGKIKNFDYFETSHLGKFGRNFKVEQSRTELLTVIVIASSSLISLRSKIHKYKYKAEIHTHTHTQQCQYL